MITSTGSLFWQPCNPMSLAFCINKLRFMYQGESNPPGSSKWLILQDLKCKNKARGLELSYEIGLTVEAYATRVRVACTIMSLSRACSFVRFLFASFSNAYKNNIWWYSSLFCARFSINKISTKQSKENTRVGNLQRVRHLGSLR